MKKRQLRDYLALCKREGVELVGIEKGGKHFRLLFEAGFITAPITPSNNRNLLNVRGEIRRLHR